MYQVFPRLRTQNLPFERIWEIKSVRPPLLFERDNNLHAKERERLLFDRSQKTEVESTSIDV